MLVLDEKDRIDWNEIFSHELFIEKKVEDLKDSANMLEL